MSSEKMVILKMLEDKKITAEEAARLLSSVGAGVTPQTDGAPPLPVLIAPEYSDAFSGTVKKVPEVPALTTTPYAEPGKPAVPAKSAPSYAELVKLTTPASPAPAATPYAEPPKPNIAGPSAPSYGHAEPSRDPRAMGVPPMGTAGGGMPAGQSPAPVYGESLAEELARKFGGFMRNMEPKFQKFAENFAEKTVSAADSISRTVAAPQPASATRGPDRAPTVARGGVERLFELTVDGPGSELSLSSLNGPVLVKGYNGDRISAKVFYVPNRGGAAIDLIKLGQKYYLHYDENDFSMVSIDVFLPERLFDNIRLSAVNGAMTVGTLRAANVKLETLNGQTDISQISADNLIVECNNGALRLQDVAAGRASVENFNGPIHALNTDVAQMKLSTFNGAVSVQMADFRCFADYAWEIDSSNGKLGMVLPSAAALGYDITATAALGVVKLGLTGLAFTRNDRTAAAARSTRFDTADKRVQMNLSTSNAALEVN